MRAELVHDAHASLGEGPLWDRARGVVHWVDIDAALWHQWSLADGPMPAVALAQTPGFLALHSDGGLVAGVESGFARLAEDGALTMLAVVEDRTDHRMNDGEADPAGRLWGSTVARSCDRPTGSLWRLDLDGSAHVVLDGVTIGNGIAFTDDGQSMLFVDSVRHSVDRMTVDPTTGAVSDRRAVVRFDPEDTPDGMCQDAEGGIWVAVWNGWSVRRYDEGGRETARVEVPAPNVTSCAFAGPDLDQLVISTAARGSTGSEHAGGLFVATPGVRGRQPFACTVGVATTPR